MGKILEEIKAHRDEKVEGIHGHLLEILSLTSAVEGLALMEKALFEGEIE